MKLICAALAITVLFAVALDAQTVWRSDPAHSRVSFTISHMVISSVTGRFKDFEATLTQTKDDLSDSKLEATIKTASISTDNDTRDKDLRSANFFDVEKFPEMKFVSKSFVKQGNDTYKVTGDLTMHGVTKEVVLDVKYKGQINNVMGGMTAAFAAKTVVNRKDFGIVWNKTLETGGILVGEEVEVNITVEMLKSKPAN